MARAEDTLLKSEDRSRPWTPSAKGAMGPSTKKKPGISRTWLLSAVLGVILYQSPGRPGEGGHVSREGVAFVPEAANRGGL